MAHNSVGLQEGLDVESPTFRLFERALEFVLRTLEASINDGLGNVLVNGPAYHVEKHVASHEPGQHEESEADIAGVGEAQVFEAFRTLFPRQFGVQNERTSKLGTTYGKKDITNVEQNQNQISDGSKVVSVRSNNQRDGDKVVAQHLPVIFTALLDMDDKNLLKPEPKLGQLIELGQASELTIRPVRP